MDKFSKPKTPKFSRLFSCLKERKCAATILDWYLNIFIKTGTFIITLVARRTFYLLYYDVLFIIYTECLFYCFTLTLNLILMLTCGFRSARKRELLPTTKYTKHHNPKIRIF